MSYQKFSSKANDLFMNITWFPQQTLFQKGVKGGFTF